MVFVKIDDSLTKKLQIGPENLKFGLIEYNKSIRNKNVRFFQKGIYCTKNCRKL